MTLPVDTSVWVLGAAPRRRGGRARGGRAEKRSRRAEVVVTTGLVLQELLQGFGPPKSRAQIVASFAAIALIQPDREDHIAAADLRNACRMAGVQLGTIDALIAQLCIRHGLTLLSTDQDFAHAARHCKLKRWVAIEPK